MEVERLEEVVIVGAGICGLATAVALKRVGIEAVVLEGWDRLRATGAALSLFPNAWLALDALGVAHKLTPLYVPFNKSLMTSVGDGATQEVSLVGADSYGSRVLWLDAVVVLDLKVLLEALAEELPIGTIHFSSKLTSIATQEMEGSPIVILQMEDGTIIKTKILIGCDGVHSKVAHWLGLAKPMNSGRLAARGLAVYPEGHGFKHEVRQFLQVGLRGTFVPLNDKEIFWALITSESIPKDLTPELIQKEIIENYAKNFPPIYLDVVRRSDLSTLTWAPLMLRLPWNVIFGNTRKGTVTVAGDAMHPMTPDLAQGGCSALEDAVVLGRHIGESFIENGRLVPREMVEAIERYVKERKWRTAGLITGAYLSGWIQQDDSSWWKRFFRDVIFYKFILPRLSNVTKYDCGKLPKLSYSNGSSNQNKKID